MVELKTRAGVVPVENEAPQFNITTADAKEYLQRKIDNAVKIIAGNGGRISDVEIALLTTPMSKKFAPFMLLMPMTVLAGKDKKQGPQELSIFNPEKTDSQANLIRGIYEVISPFVYNKDDEACFFSQTTRNELALTLKSAHELKAYRTPRVQSFNNGKNKYVACFIDPLRLFYDMLGVNGSNVKYNVEIAGKEKITDSNYQYEVYRTTKKKKSKDERSFEEKLALEIARRVGGR